MQATKLRVIRPAEEVLFCMKTYPESSMKIPIGDCPFKPSEVTGRMIGGTTHLYVCNSHMIMWRVDTFLFVNKH